MRPALLLGSAIVAVLLVGGCLPENDEADAAAGAPAALPVDVATPVVKDIVEWDEYTGRFEAVDRVDLRARVSGYLESVHFRDGQMVNEGDLLFVIDPRPFVAALDQAKAELERAQAQLELADLDLSRGESLLRTRNISRESVDERRAAKKEALASVAEATASVRAAELDLEFTRIMAPVSGRISDRKVDVAISSPAAPLAPRRWPRSCRWTPSTSFSMRRRPISCATFDSASAASGHPLGTPPIPFTCG